MLKGTIVMIASMLLAMTASANKLTIGGVAYGGNGCPSGTASATVSPDGQAVSVLFDQFIAEAGGSTGKSLDRKSCNLTVPILVPGGYSVAIFTVDYRGFNQVPSGGFNRFESEYFWAGARGPKISRQFNGPVSDSFTLTDNLLATTVVWAPCGQSVNLRVNAAMMAKTNRTFAQTLGMVDSADIASAVVYRFQFRRCR